MYMKECGKCGGLFEYNDGEEWKKICINCWRADKNKQNVKPAAAARGRLYEDVLQDRIVAYEKMISDLRVKNANLQRDLAFGGVSQKISKEDLKRIRMLVHPDKHGNSAMSNSMTQLINKLIN